MQMHNVRKTHPMVLIAAVAITVFSLLGSAVITGLIPGLHTEKQGAMEPSTIGSEAATAVIQSAPINKSESKDPYITNYKSRIQPHPSKPTSKTDKNAACGSCGKVVSISLAEQEGDGFMIKVRMQNGSYRTITQYSEPHLRVGDHVNLISKELIMA